MDHTGAERRGRAPCDPPLEDEAHLLRSAEVEVVVDRLLEEGAPHARLVEHLGEADLGLHQGDRVLAAALAVRGRERPRECMRPASYIVGDRSGAETVADRLQTHAVVAGEKAVVQLGETDARLVELALGPLVGVHVDTPGKRHVRAHLEKARSELGIENIEVEPFHADRRRHEAKPRTPIRLGLGRPHATERTCPLLGGADEHHPGVALHHRFGEQRADELFLAHVLGEGLEPYAVIASVAFDAAHVVGAI